MKRFVPEKYGMMFCPDCDGQGRICGPDDVKVCQHCGGFGFIRKERETYVASKNGPFPPGLKGGAWQRRAGE